MYNRGAAAERPRASPADALNAIIRKRAVSSPALPLAARLHIYAEDRRRACPAARPSSRQVARCISGRARARAYILKDAERAGNYHDAGRKGRLTRARLGSLPRPAGAVPSMIYARAAAPPARQDRRPGGQQAQLPHDVTRNVTRARYNLIEDMCVVGLSTHKGQRFFFSSLFLFLCCCKNEN